MSAWTQDLQRYSALGSPAALRRWVRFSPTGRRRFSSGATLSWRFANRGGRFNNDFLTGSREAVQAVLDLVDEDTGEVGLGPLCLALDEHFPRLMHRLAEVDLEGPQIVSDAANEAIAELNKLHTTAFVGDISGLVDDEGRPVRIGGDFMDEVRTALKEFVVAARAALATDADRGR
ncbi:hypothetical protein OG436_33260 [Streptomyces caniferus]|uniref:hypothetical protein n=1 Tax=Streptomyces caniferus TaxID=285557 RepID=UPI002E28B0BD|nr:hypothetical protein [Streptomyces caniferus]